MGIGKEIGEQVNCWLSTGELISLPPQALANRLIDAAGSAPRLRGPLQTLGLDPLFQQLLREQNPAKARALLNSLTSELAALYTPLVLAELCDLAVAASGLVHNQSTASGSKTPTSSGPAVATANRRTHLWRLVCTFRPLAPGVALAAGSSLVLAWLGSEFDRVLFEHLGWSSGVILLFFLVLVQLVTRWGFRPFRSAVLLDRSSAVDPRQAWRWVTAPWVHASDKESLINVVTLGFMICTTPLSLRDQVLRYALSSLACMVMAIQCSRWCHLRRIWGGASGFTAMLLSLDVTLSVLHWQEFNFTVGAMRIPAWVLLWTYLAIQTVWTVPVRFAGESSGVWQRVISTSWAWGLPVGAILASLTWLASILQQ